MVQINVNEALLSKMLCLGKKSSFISPLVWQYEERCRDLLSFLIKAGLRDNSVNKIKPTTTPS